MIVRWQPLSQMDSLRRQIDDVFNELDSFQADAQRAWGPAIELIDTPDSFQLQAQLPGVDPDSIDIEATRDAIKISGERPVPERVEHRTYLRSEFAYGKFQRLIRLPVEITPEEIQADFYNGLLTLTLPKAENARRHMVKVQVKELAGNSDQKALNVAKEEVAG